MDLALTTTNERLQSDQDLAERTNMSISNIMKLLEFVVNHNYFKHDNTHYRTNLKMCDGIPNQSRYSRPHNGRD